MERAGIFALSMEQTLHNFGSQADYICIQFCLGRDLQDVMQHKKSKQQCSLHLYSSLGEKEIKVFSSGYVDNHVFSQMK